jgi:YD repeat-containing protein
MFQRALFAVLSLVRAAHQQGPGMNHFERAVQAAWHAARYVTALCVFGFAPGVLAGFPADVPEFTIQGATGGAGCGPAITDKFYLPAAPMCNEVATRCAPGSYGFGRLGDGPNEVTGQVTCQPFRIGGDQPEGAFFLGPSSSGCPPNSSLVGTLCECQSGYREKANKCVPDVDPTKPCCGVGNPIDAGSGVKAQPERDYAGTGPFPLVHERNYRHAPLALVTPTDITIFGSALGRNWTGSYRQSIELTAIFIPMSIVVHRPDGRSYGFREAGGVFLPEADVADKVERILINGKKHFRYTASNGDFVELYDFTGKLLSITNRAGLVQTMEYSTGSTPTSIAPRPNLLLSASDPFGRKLSFTYDFFARLKTMSPPGGGTYTFAYPTGSTHNANHISVTGPDAKIRTYHYNESAHTAGANLPNALTGITDENTSRFSTYKYDAQGRAVQSEHSGGAQRYTIQYNLDGTSTVGDPLTGSRAYNFQNVVGVLNPTSITGDLCPACGPAAQTFDANGNAESRTDWNGNRTNYTYDLTRNLETSRTEGLTTGGGTTPQTRTISAQWHATYRLPTVVAEPLRITTNVYDADGTQCGARGALCSRSIQATTDANGSQGFSATPTGIPRAWAYTYNSNGSVLAVNGPRTDVSDVTTYSYHPTSDPDLGKRGNVATITNAASHVTSVTAYNAHGQPLTMVDANGLTTTLTYDARQRLKTRTVGSELTTYDYDDVGQLIKVTLPDLSFLSYTYDAAHRLKRMEDNEGNRIEYTLDAMGNRTLEQVFGPASALAQTRSRVYSNLNRLFQQLGGQSQTTEYTYDNQGNVLTVKDPLNQVTTNQYDALNRLKQMTSPPVGSPPVSPVTQYAYNGLDALAQVTDPRNLVTAYTVDGLGNLTLQASPDTGNTVNTHDLGGNLLTQTDAKGQVTTYAYDALNRVALITFHDGSKQAYAYDLGTNGVGRLSSITETDAASQQTSVIAYAYSPHGRVTSETRTVNGMQYVVGYSYDTNGRLAGLTYPSGRTLTYSFDTLGRVAAISTTGNGQTQQVVSSVAYHPFGGVKGYTLGNGQPYTRSYDQDGRISTYSLGAKSFGIGYDAASRIEFISELGNPPNSNTYGYDNLDRLTSATTPGTPYVYTYDATGNRLTKSAGARTETLTMSTTSNRIATLTPASGPARSFVFDPNGSTTNDGINSYVYDVRGRMVQATSAIGTSTYHVNALGQRIRKSSSLGDTVFHYDSGGRLIAETNAAGILKREVIYLGDIPVGVVQ